MRGRMGFTCTCRGIGWWSSRRTTSLVNGLVDQRVDYSRRVDFDSMICGDRSVLIGYREEVYVFVSQAIHETVRVHAMNDAAGFGPSDHCRIRIAVE